MLFQAALPTQPGNVRFVRFGFDHFDPSEAFDAVICGNDTLSDA
jgi:hypothetical protein